MNQNNNVISLPQNVAVVIDGWNALRGADQVLDFGDQIDRYVLDFGKLADEIAAQRNRPSRVVSVTVVIGVHNRAQNPRARMIADQNIRFWQRDKRVQVIAFENHWESGIEKGVDMELGLQVMDQASDPKVDSVVVFSADRDLQPAVDRAVSKPGAHIELARWEGQSAGLWIRQGNGKPGWCHWLGSETFHKVATPRGHQLAA
ncbi:NYN domain-containing protein [Dietzia sp. NPDC055877]